MNIKTFFAILIVAVGLIMVPGQDKSDDLSLSPFEIDQRKPLLVAFEKAMNNLNGMIESGKAINSDADAKAFGYKASSICWQLSAARSGLGEWLQDVRKNHKCLDCELDAKGDKLVRPAPKDTADKPAK